MPSEQKLVKDFTEAAKQTAKAPGRTDTCEEATFTMPGRGALPEVCIDAIHDVYTPYTRCIDAMHDLYTMYTRCMHAVYTQNTRCMGAIYTLYARHIRAIYMPPECIACI